MIACIMLLGGLLAGFFSIQVVGYEPDEIGYTHLAQNIAHSFLPITLENGGQQRLNQLYPLLIAPFWGAFNDVTAFRLVHIWNALVMSSTAIPAYLLTYHLTRVRWAAYLAAAIIVLAPWMTLASSELTEVAAFPAFVWALFATQRALVEPSPRRDLLALALIVLATYGRLQLALLAPVFVVAMLLHEVGYALISRRREGYGHPRLRENLLRGHALLSVCAVAGVLVGVPLLASGKLASSAGFYGDTLSGISFGSATFDLARSYLSFLIVGVGILPAVVTIGFVGESLVAPVSRRVHAFASLGLVVVVAFTLQVAEVTARFDEGVLQERYLFYLFPILVIGLFVGLLFSRHPVRIMLAGAVAVAALIGTTHYQAARDAFWYQVSPAMTGFYDWVRPIFGAAGGPTSDPGTASMAPIVAVVLVAALAVALASRRVARSRLLLVVASVVLVICCAQTTNALWRVVHGNANGVGYGTGSLRDVDWVDKTAPSGSMVGQVVANIDGLGNSRGLWETSEFWNRAIGSAYSFGAVGDSYFPTVGLRVNADNGSVLTSNDSKTPGYMVTTTRGFPVQLSGVVVAKAPRGALELLKAATPLAAAWSVEHVSSDGWLALNQPATMRIYRSAANGARCLRVDVTVSLSSLSASSRALMISGRGVRRLVPTAPGETRTITAPVCRSFKGVVWLRISSQQGAAAVNPQLTLQLKRITVTPA